MLSFRKFVTVLTISLSFLLYSTISVLASPTFGEVKPDEVFSPSPEPGLGYMGYTAYPFYSVAGSHPGLIGMKTEGKKVLSIERCNAISDVRCADSDYFQFRSTLSFCETDTETNCIVDVYAENESGVALKVNRTNEYFTEKTHHYSGDLSIGLPPGKSPPLVEIPDAPHAGGTLYLPLVTSYGKYDKVLDKAVTNENGEIALFAVSKVNGNYSIATMSNKPTSYPEKQWRSGEGDPTLPCVFNNTTQCAKAWPIPSNLRLGISIRNSGSIKGWFHGRITNPSIKQEKGPGAGITLTVWGKPIQVPSISLWRKKTELPEQVKKYYAERKLNEFPLGGIGTGAGNTDLQNGSEDKWSLMRTNNTDFDQSKLDEFLAWVPVSGDKANLLPSVWY